MCVYISFLDGKEQMPNRGRRKGQQIARRSTLRRFLPDVCALRITRPIGDTLSFYPVLYVMHPIFHHMLQGQLKWDEEREKSESICESSQYSFFNLHMPA